MAVRVSPTEPNPTHHFSLKDRDGRTLGLTVCDERGERREFKDERIYIKNPVDTTALKQTSGTSSYSDFAYPYSPIVQDDLSGGRGSIDFERDATRYYDSFRARSGKANKAYAGALEKYVTGVRNQDQNLLTTSVKWIQLTGTQRYLYKRFQASASYTVGSIWLLVRRLGTPSDMTVAIYSDNVGAIDTELSSITMSYTDTDDILMEWLNKTASQSLSAGSYYWLVVDGSATDNNEKHWKIGTHASSGTTYASSTFTANPTVTSYDLLFRLTDTNTSKTCIPFKHMEQQFFIISGASGAPTVYMAGDRGAADANTGQLGKLIDATKNWTANEHAGVPVVIISGTGRLEKKVWRTITSNTASELVLDEPYTITHDTTTNYVILGSKLRSLGACGLTAPVTDVYVSLNDIVYVCQGDGVAIMALRAFNSSGTWLDFDNAANCQRAETDARSKAVYMTYKPQAKKLVIGNNYDASGNVSVSLSSNVSGSDPIVPAWGTSITWATAVNVDSRFIRMNGLIIYPDIAGNEAVWVLKEDCPYVVPASNTVYQAGVDEMKAVRNELNGKNATKQGLYLFIPLLQGLTQYYGGQFTDVGANLGEGLPTNRRGAVVSMQPYPGRILCAIDAGASGYSSILDSDGWHESYRAPRGQRITSVTFQPVPGTTSDRLWMWQGNDLMYLPFPSDTTNELEDANYKYTPEFAITLSRFHAGMFDIQKIIKKIKLQTENLEVNTVTGEPICWFELDYKIGSDETFTTVPDSFTTSPTQEVDFTKQFGLAGTRIQLRIRGYTTDTSKTPIFLASIVNAVLRVDVKYFYGQFTFLLQDDENIGLRELDDEYSADEKRRIMESWGDATNDSMLLLNSVSQLCDNQMIFMNVGSIRQIGFKGAENNPFKGDAYLMSVTFQEA